MYRDKRDLLQRQKRPTTETKETYYRDKRDLLHSKMLRPAALGSINQMNQPMTWD